MQTLHMHSFKVAGMTCGHCVKAITRALQALDPTAEVRVELGAGEVRVSSQEPRERLAEVMREEGYQVTPG